ncbi:hypothetical protein NQ317_016912 [Molorchus minor]|uniref:AVL9/DENND6 domain-containing protein n=1 Tax=Molorchus minor TaxID=1323400 RepID=A0ABQ9K4M1_9CUCU|nr:hypothetical protein NQ317_016912 [Molorchus minor]
MELKEEKRERESKQNLMTWTYPTITDGTKSYVISRCFFAPQWRRDFSFTCGKTIPGFILNILLRIHKNVPYKEILDLVKLYLNLITTGAVCYQDNGTELNLPGKNYNTETNIKALIGDFGREIILLYNAILLKRRILVYHHDIEKLQRKLIALTNLVPIRKPSEFLCPPNGISFYLAGTIDEYSEKGEKYFDIHVNLVTNEIIISKEAKDCFVMSKIHKDLAYVLVELAGSDLNERKVIDEIQNKTNDILKQLHSIANCVTDNRKMLSINDLKSKKV